MARVPQSVALGDNAHTQSFSVTVLAEQRAVDDDTLPAARWKLRMIPVWDDRVSNVCVYTTRERSVGRFFLWSLSRIYSLDCTESYSNLDCRLDSSSDVKDALVLPVVPVQSVWDPHCYSAALYILHAVRV